MKKILLIATAIILTSILSRFCFAQVKDSLVQLTPAIGDTIDLSERNYYNFFPDIKDYHCAMIYLDGDSTTVTKIICRNDEGLVQDTVINNSADYLGNTKAYIRQINAERRENFDSDDKITVTKLDGEKFVGKLLSVQNSSFIICPDTISVVSTQDFLRTYTKLNTEEVESINIDFDNGPSVRVGAILGGITGCVAGVAIGINNQVLVISSFEGTDNLTPYVGGLVGFGVGALIGVGVGYLLSPADETIEINSSSDLEKLKEYVVQ